VPGDCVFVGARISLPLLNRKAVVVESSRANDFAQDACDEDVLPSKERAAHREGGLGQFGNKSAVRLDR